MMKKKIDIHVHLSGVGDNGSGCYISEKMKKGITYRYLLRMLGIQKADSIDEAYIELLVSMLRESPIDAAVILAHDGIYDEKGDLDRERTNIYVPNDHIIEAAKEHDELLPGASINLNRSDAIDELARCVEMGIVLVKIHPNIQGVDPMAEKHVRFFEKMAKYRLPLLVHTGWEHSMKVVSQKLGDPYSLRRPLEAGLTVIAAHCGTSGYGHRVEYFDHFVEMLDKYDNLYGDTSVLATPLRWKYLPKIIENGRISARVIHGSDFPYPSNALGYFRWMSLKRAIQLNRTPNLIERDYAIKKEIGVPDDTCHRGYDIIVRDS